MQDSGTLIASIIARLKSITHPLMLDRYNLRGQEASDDSGAFFFLEYFLAENLLGRVVQYFSIRALLSGPSGKL
jgi:hypothetical protein